MSWFGSGKVNTKEQDWESQVHNAKVPVDIEEIRKAQEEQVTWAKEAVIDAIECKVVGGTGEEGGEYTFQISGHANPNHKPRSGWANDVVTITIAQAAPPVRT